MNNENHDDTYARMDECVANGNGKVDFTIEQQRGETYNDPDTWALYAHDEYESSSVLAGQSRRCFIDEIGTEAEADAFLKGAPDGRFALDKIGGTTHVPVDQVVGHLPDEDGNCWYGRTPDGEPSDC